MNDNRSNHKRVLVALAVVIGVIVSTVMLEGIAKVIPTSAVVWYFIVCAHMGLDTNKAKKQGVAEDALNESSKPEHNDAKDKAARYLRAA